ncbi:helix-turn-helix domain-containing protein [uncultured Clostridium sp.]|uniref:helix-turn-helix domain-containing protein n=1 Tax=uncultured Clostridium sp. TaxID=59620 RepID=UPI002604D421|nr:helix-turn-helix transcriptional regulator [uncultured Clostridium sp.]
MLDINKGNTLGARIRYVRNKMQCTGEEFGKLLNVTKVAVSNWEKDNRKPDVDMLVRIANLGNVTTDFLLCKTDTENNIVSKIDVNKENLILELSKEVYPNGITREEIIEKLKIFKQLEESGVKFVLKN